MIPTFPRFSQLRLNHRQAITAYDRQFPVYSDYNFVSLWSYNVDKAVLISCLNDNLVVRFTDYLNRKKFYSFFGNRKVLQTAQILIEYSKKNNNSRQLKLIPHINIAISRNSLKKHLRLIEDRDNFDYILSVKALSRLPGPLFQKKRWRIRRFSNDYPDVKKSVTTLKSRWIHKETIDLFHRWAQSHNISQADSLLESTALKRFLSLPAKKSLYAIALHHKRVLIGLATVERVNHLYAIGHFIKADLSYLRIFDYLFHITGQYLESLNCRYLNIAQDLGLENLRKAKLSWKPVRFLKKYIISEPPT